MPRNIFEISLDEAKEMLENEVDQDERQELEDAIHIYSECIKKLDGKILGWRPKD